mgnify:CR=1 FL=1
MKSLARSAPQPSNKLPGPSNRGRAAPTVYSTGGAGLLYSFAAKQPDLGIGARLGYDLSATSGKTEFCENRAVAISPAYRRSMWRPLTLTGHDASEFPSSHRGAARYLWLCARSATRKRKSSTMSWPAATRWC